MQVQTLVDTVNQILINRKLTKAPLRWPNAIGPAITGKNAYAIELDRASFQGRLEALYTDEVLHDISTAFGGARVLFLNSIGFAFAIDFSRPAKPEPVDLLSAIEPERCYLVVGPRRTGKTTLLQHIAANHEGPVVVFDPKIQTPGKWGRAEVVGANGDYEAVGRRMAQMVKQMFNGGVTGERVLVVCDELWNLLQADRDAVTDLWKLVTLGGEAGLDVLIGTHSGRVEGLGIAGQGDLRDAFSIVNLAKVRDRYTATIDYGQGPVPARLPGPFEGQAVVSVSPGLTDAERILVKLSVEKLGGSFSQQALLAAVKADEALAPRAEAGGDLTEYRIRQISTKLLRQGLLVAEDNTLVPPRPRMVGGKLTKWSHGW